jgi:peptidoglycan/xylan/chitin deacetylase (PgdA/CDA1 family)
MSLTGVALPVQSAPAQTTLAVTVDDVPWNGIAPPDGADGGTSRLLAVLKRRDVPAIGFVVCDRMTKGSPIASAWLEAGMELGSHSAAHRDLNAGLALWLADVRRCDDELADLNGVRGGYFRFPYLHQGPTREARDSAADELSAMGYRTAHVSIDNSEWILAREYGTALENGDSVAMQAIGAAYVEHMLDALDHFRAVARRKFGREVAQILLIHANALNADWLGAVLDAYAERGVKFVSLETALADPVYSLPDAYIGRRGLSWLYRAEPLSPEDPWDEAAESALVERFSR